MFILKYFDQIFSVNMEFHVVAENKFIFDFITICQFSKVICLMNHIEKTIRNKI